MRLKFVSKTGLIISITGSTNVYCYLILFSFILIVSMEAQRLHSEPEKFNLTFVSQPEVLVIGAGAAGIAATTELVRNGFQHVILLEAENRTGGRVCTQQLFNETLVDLGGEFYEGLKHDEVWKITEPYHNELKDQPSEKFTLFQGEGKAVDENMRLNLFKFLNEFQEDEDCDNVKSVGECFEKKFDAFINSSDPEFAEFLQKSRTWSRTMLHLFSMAPNLYDWGLGSHPTKGPLWTWKNHGYSVVLDIMMGKWPDPSKKLLKDSQILLNKEVVKIEDWRSNASKIVVKCADNSVYKADHVICTVSLGVLKAVSNDLFQPALPKEKQEAIQKSGFGPLSKIILHFKEPVKLVGSVGVIWESDEFSEHIMGRDLAWLQWLSFIIPSENNPKVLICFYTGKGVPLIESLAEDIIMAGQIHLTQKILKPQSIVSDYPDQFVRTSWNSNPHFRGVNSYNTVWGDFRKELAGPVPSEEDPKILFAGEATHPTYYTTVHGAVETGIREARRLTGKYTNKKS